MVNTQYDTIIIGGGPSGLAASIASAGLNCSILLLERNSSVGRKLLLTGKGRCNFTHFEAEIDRLINYYGNEGSFLYSCFSRFSPQNIADFFKKLGVDSVIEPNGRMFPASQKASDILNALIKEAKAMRVHFQLNSRVKKINYNKNRFTCILENKESISAKTCIIASGGKSYPHTGSTGDGYGFAKDLEHTVVQPVPALVPIKTEDDDNYFKDLQGVSLKEVEVKIVSDNKVLYKETGDIVFTHFGLSGPAILNISGYIAELLIDHKARLSLDLLPSLSKQELMNSLQTILENNPQKSIGNGLSHMLPSSLAAVIIQKAGIIPLCKTKSISIKKLNEICEYIKGFDIKIKGTLGFKYAMTTRGGVSLQEINPKNMQSRIIPGLFFAGEILNLDSPTGGYNLQLCWSSGFLAGESAANFCKRGS